jgi:carbamoyl-phosphate synthase small subunit
LIIIPFQIVAELNPRLILEDGSIFDGVSFGAEKSIAGEVVFNTGMVGYPESLTDPSYHGQILVLTYPLIGNYGIAQPVKKKGLIENFESERIQIAGLIVANYSYQHSHWDSVKSLSAWLKQEKIPALSGIDCRALTKKLREKGVMLGKIVLGNQDIPVFDPNQKNLVQEVSIKEPIIYKQGKKRVALIDCGAKHNIILNLLKRGVTVIRFPWDYNIFENSDNFDAIVISNGPGNPKMVDKTIQTIKQALTYSLPILGICLGNQILALACGADTYKLKYGHRSQNQPCVEIDSQRCFITAQNHGYAVNENTLPEGFQVWFRNANDNTNEGIRHWKKPIRSIQFHPEATPGPTDTEHIFDEFLSFLKK